MSLQPLVSIVIPSYNHAAYVEEAIASVGAQSWPRLELVIVDDGSRDDSPARIGAACERLPVERVEFVQQPNGGAHAAINRGLALSRGEFIQILNSDDRLAPNRIARLIEALADSACDFAFTDLQVIDRDGGILPNTHRVALWRDECAGNASSEPSVEFGLLRANVPLTTSNFFFRRRLLEHVPEFTPERLCHDWRFLLRCMAWTSPCWVREPLLDYRIHASNTVDRVASLAPAEGAVALREYLTAVMEAPPFNRLAPSPYWWPGFFQAFIANRRSWFSPAPIATYLPTLTV